MAYFDPFAESGIQAYDNIVPESGVLQSAEAAYRLGKMGTATALLEADEERDKFRATEVYDPQRLNQMFPHLEKPFTRPTPIGVANEIARRAEERRKLQRIIQEGPDNVFQSVLNFAAQTAPHSVDKWEFGAGLAGTAAMNLMLGPVGVAASLGTVLARSFLGNLAGNALVEPILAYQTAESQEEYTVADAFQSVVGGALLGTVIETGGVGALRTYRNFKAADGNFQTRFKTAIAQAVKGKKVDVDVESKGMNKDGKSAEPPPIPGERVPPVLREANDIPPLPEALRRNLPPPIPVDRIPALPAEGTPTIPVTATAAIQGGRIKAGGLIGDTEVLYVDSTRASQNLTRKGTLAEVDISNLRILDATIPRDGVDLEIQALIDDIAADTEVSLQNPSLQQAIEAAPNKVRDMQYKEVKAILDDLGYDGVSFRETVDGKSVTGVNIFRMEQNKMSNLREYNPRGGTKNTARSTEVKRSMLSTESDFYYDADTRAKYDNLQDGFIEERNVEVPDETLLNREDLSPPMKKLYDELEELKSREEVINKALREAYRCRE